MKECGTLYWAQIYFQNWKYISLHLNWVILCCAVEIVSYQYLQLPPSPRPILLRPNGGLFILWDCVTNHFANLKEKWRTILVIGMGWVGEEWMWLCGYLYQQSEWRKCIKYLGVVLGTNFRNLVYFRGLLWRKRKRKEKKKKRKEREKRKRKRKRKEKVKKK